MQRDHRPSAPGKAGRTVHVFSEVVKKALFIDNRIEKLLPPAGAAVLSLIHI